MARKSVEIAVEILHIYFYMRSGLRAVNKYRHTTRMRERGHLLDRIYCTQRIRDVHHTDELCALVEKFLVFINKKLPGVIDGHDAYLRSFLFRQHLPGHDV